MSVTFSSTLSVLILHQSPATPTLPKREIGDEIAFHSFNESHDDDVHTHISLYAGEFLTKTLLAGIVCAELLVVIL